MPPSNEPIKPCGKRTQAMLQAQALLRKVPSGRSLGEGVTKVPRTPAERISRTPVPADPASFEGIGKQQMGLIGEQRQQRHVSQE